MYRCGIETVSGIQIFILSLCINCTVVELKLGNKQLKRIGFGSINCTVVELKRRKTDYVYFCCMCINCTVVELKQVATLVVSPDETVLIVPLWN